MPRAPRRRPASPRRRAGPPRPRYRVRAMTGRRRQRPHGVTIRRCVRIAEHADDGARVPDAGSIAACRDSWHPRRKSARPRARPAGRWLRSVRGTDTGRQIAKGARDELSAHAKAEDHDVVDASECRLGSSASGRDDGRPATPPIAGATVSRRASAIIVMMLAAEQHLPHAAVNSSPTRGRLAQDERELADLREPDGGRGDAERRRAARSAPAPTIALRATMPAAATIRSGAGATSTRGRPACPAR